VPRLHRCLGRPRISRRTLYRRLRQVALWRRPKLIARGDLPQPLAQPAPDRCRTLDQPLVPDQLPTKLLESRSAGCAAGQA
jgi:hypothetical protein